MSCCGGAKEEALLKNGHPAWYKPQSGDDLGVKIYNSLTDDKEPFIPMEGRQVKMYLCGPTVYDMSHVGHARTYLTFDIMRRIMEDYFGYDVLFQVNITDIDDKIIQRARQNHLVDQYTKENSGNQKKVLADVTEAMAKWKNKLQTKLEELQAPAPADMPAREVAERGDKLKEQEFKVQQYEGVFAKLADMADASVTDLIALGRDPMAARLDDELKHTVTDNAVFNAHGRKYEKLFLEDLESLGIKGPDILTRITEYVPETVEFTKTIVDKGLAYESNGSIYFDTQEFKNRGHDYPKLVPTAGRATAAEMLESEGALSSNFADDKKHPNDFALWKKSKPGECKWPSPWGEGRPGWHIECSVMASCILGEKMDIHGGGSDLRFPHHDNECAQSEAYHGTQQWVNYFAHAGHLHIKGLKMSKSLKNFITIRESLEIYSPRQVRIMFLMVGWDKPMEYSDHTLQAACSKEKQFKDWFGKVKTLLRAAANEEVPRSQAWTDHEKKLNSEIMDVQNSIRAALQDNFNYPLAMQELSRLMTCVNNYIAAVGESNAKQQSVAKAAQYVTKMLRVFGVVTTEDIGMDDSAGATAEEAVAPIMDAFAKFRETVRDLAKTHGVKDLLVACDDVRDKDLPAAGVRLEDRPGQTASWRCEKAEDLLKEIAEKAAAQKEVALAKLRNKIQLAEKEIEKFEDAAKPPLDNLKQKLADKYKEWSEEGLPTLTAEGEEISSKAKKNIQKDLQKMQKAHDDLKTKAKDGVDKFLEDLRTNLQKLQEQLN